MPSDRLSKREVVSPQSHSLDLTQPTISQSLAASGLPQSFNVLPANGPNPQANTDAYVPSDAFRVSHGNYRVDAPVPPQFSHHTSTPSAPAGDPHRFSSNSNVPRPQSQSFRTRTPSSQILRLQGGHAPRFSREFISSDPFHAAYDDEKVDAPSSFDDIPTPGFSSYGPFPNQSTYEEHLRNNMTALGAHGQHNWTSPGIDSIYGSQPWYQSHNSTQPRIDSTYYGSQESQPWSRPQSGAHRSPYVTGTQIPNIQRPPFIPQPTRDDTSSYEHDDISDRNNYLVYTQLPTPVSFPSVQSHAPVLPVPSSQHSHTTIPPPNADDVTPPVDPVDQLPSPSHSQGIPSTSSEPERANLGTFESYYISESGYPGPPHRSDQDSDLPKKSMFSRHGLTHFFRRLLQRSTHSLANPPPLAAMYPQPSGTTSQPSTDSEIHWHRVVLTFLSVTFPRRMYLYLLLQLPSLYHSRVARIFEDANMSLPAIKKMALETASQGLTQHEFEIHFESTTSNSSPAYKRLTLTWESFIDSVMREWKVLNIISVLLLTAILTILQIPDAAEDSLTRYAALYSLICSLISLLFGCVYIIRFSTMRRTYKAAEWALEAKKTKNIWWNVWIMLAMPAVWLTWSIILYIVCIMSFVWRTEVANNAPSGLSKRGLLALRISITIVLAIGSLYGYLIMTTFQRYGAVMDKAWKQRVDKWIEASIRQITSVDNPPSHGSYPDPSIHRPHTSNHSLHRQTSLNDTNGRYPHSSVHPPQTQVVHRLSDESPRELPHATSTNVLPTINVDLSNVQDHGRVPSAAYIPNSGIVNPPRPIATSAEVLPETIPAQSLTPILESPSPSSSNGPGEGNHDPLGFSSGLKTRDNGDGDAPREGNRVRFRSVASGHHSPRKAHTT